MVQKVNNPAFTVHNLKHWYNLGVVLDIPSFSVEEGSAVGLVGQNGSGKSTLLRMIAFLEEPREGNVTYHLDENGLERARGSISFLLQEPYLLKRSVYQNITYGLKVRRDTVNLEKRAREALAQVGLDPGSFLHRKWYQLSGGEAQRVALASRLILRPRVLLLDEPTASVDKVSASLIKDAAARFREETGATLIVASHDLIWLGALTDTIYHLHNGRIVGTESYNIITGPWSSCERGLVSRKLAGGGTIFASCAPSLTSTALLDPAHIMVSRNHPGEISARNILKGVLVSLVASREVNSIRLEVEAGGMVFSCLVTEKSVSQNGYLPGQEIYLFFKASSIQWE